MTWRSPPAEKLALFRTLFRGREDVYPRRWESARSGRSGYAFACANEWKPTICRKPEVPCRDCDHREYLPLDDGVLEAHLRGEDPQARPRAGGERADFTAGVYPLLEDESTWFLAADFDKGSWREDADAYLEACREAEVPAALERSRSGRGGHVWVFFSEPVPARVARRLGSALITRALDLRPELGMESYDRLFPSQDRMPRGGLGNLIALPLQGRSRAAGNAVFVDQDGEPHPDQWAFLASTRRLSLAEVEERCQALGSRDLEEPKAGEQAPLPWARVAERRAVDPSELGELPEKVRATLAQQVFIEKAGLPPALRHRMMRLASFGNPEFFRAQRMRFSTHDKPRYICCAEDFPEHLGLPRGCLEDLRALLAGRGVELELVDERSDGEPLGVEFQGKLRPEQVGVLEALVAHEAGVLAAPTGFGKTVLGAALIARRGVSALVLVHRRELLEQWHAQLTSLLGLGPREVGRIGGGKRKATGRVDVAMVQSLRDPRELAETLEGYGHVLVDECHHASAVSVEAVLKMVRPRFVAGLSATVRRKDGHHPIVFMQCGPLRHEVDPRVQAAARPFAHRVRVRPTEFQLEEALGELPIQEVYRRLVEDPARNELVLDDVISAVDEGRCPVLLAERREHVAYFEGRLGSFVKNLFVLHGGLRPKARRETLARMAALGEDEERLLVATGRYLGEGFDDPRLDTLFLVHPISWRGTLRQYVGRLHRVHGAKAEVRVYDYRDPLVPVLEKMFSRRVKGYRGLGYEVG